MDGGTEEDHRRMRESRGITARNGYRVCTKVKGPVTQKGWRKINESDLPGLLAVATHGEFGIMPKDTQEIQDLRQYVRELS